MSADLRSTLAALEQKWRENAKGFVNMPADSGWYGGLAKAYGVCADALAAVLQGIREEPQSVALLEAAKWAERQLFGNYILNSLVSRGGTLA